MHRRFFSVLSGAVDRGAASHGRSAGGHDPDSNYGGAPSVTLGGPISDTATLRGGDNPTVTITFTVFRRARRLDPALRDPSRALTPPYWRELTRR